jgi:hypothetical protein
MDAILAQIFLSPFTLHTRTLPEHPFKDSGTAFVAQLFLPKQFFTLSAKQHPDFLPRFLCICLSSVWFK